jgi:hypothetical protein
MITSSLAISEEKVGGGNDQDEEAGDITNFENWSGGELEGDLSKAR